MNLPFLLQPSANERFSPSVNANKGRDVRPETQSHVWNWILTAVWISETASGTCHSNSRAAVQTQARSSAPHLFIHLSHFRLSPEFHVRRSVFSSARPRFLIPRKLIPSWEGGIERVSDDGILRL